MRVFLSLMMLLLAFSSVQPADAADTMADRTADKTRLQAAMQQYIDRNKVGDALLQLDFETGETRELYPTQAHPMIMQMGEHYVLCADLRDIEGKPVPVDFYIAPNGRRFTVYHTEIGNRSPLKALMQRGVVKNLR
ncbi:MAG: hypothetical protein R3C70_14675 [Geminicoccaceae bacterium]